MPVRRYEKTSETTEDEVIALKLKYKCDACAKTFSTERGLNIHSSRWCRPEGPPRSRKGTLADKAVKKQKRVKQAAEMPRVSIEGVELENVLGFDYLGCQVTGDGDDSADMYHRMHIAAERFNGMNHVWRDNRLRQCVKLDLYIKSVCSVFTHGSEAWTLEPPIKRAVNGFNSRCLHRITGRSYQLEASQPTFDLVKALRQRRLRWLGHIMRMPANRLLRQTVAGIAGNGPPYAQGSILMDCGESWFDIESRAADRTAWATFVNDI